MFKIISTTRYQELTKAVSAMTPSTASEIGKLKLEHAQAVQLLNETFKRKEERITEDNRIAMERKTAEVDLVVQKAEKKLKDENQKLTIELANYKKETEILTKAFENMGFDVKDMKEILNKLVDGIVSKNQIQLVK